MIGLLLALSLTFGEPEIPSTRCHFTSVCATSGECDDMGKMCGTTSQASCQASFRCAVMGSCKWVTGKAACYGDDPGKCAADQSPCRFYGNCKAGKPGLHYCQATMDGCRKSEVCRAEGRCAAKRAYDGSLWCRASPKGCRESLDCKRRGNCVMSRDGESCDHDPRACADSYECREFGSCQSNGGMCAFLENSDCRQSRKCSTYGLCEYNYQYCDPNDRSCARTACVPANKEPCTGSEVCTRFGACQRNTNRCSTVAVTPTCVTKVVKVKSISASTTQPDWSGISLSASNLIDGRYDSSWAPAPDVVAPHRLRIELVAAAKVAGIRIAPGFHRIDPNEGILAHASGTPRGVAIYANGTVQDVFELRRNIQWQSLLIAPVDTQVIELEIFDSIVGQRFDHYAVTELEVLACE